MISSVVTTTDGREALMVGTKGKRGCIGNGRTLRATPAHKPHIQEVLTIPTAATFTVMMSMATLALPLPKTGERIDQQSLTRFDDFHFLKK